MSATLIRTRLKDFGTTSDVYNIAVGDIEVDPDFNVRMNTPELADKILSLRDSMLEIQFQRTRPLIVRLTLDKRVVLVDGHCRLAAVRLANEMGAGIENLPCLSEPKGTTDAQRNLMLLTANNGLPLSPLEQAEVVKRLIANGLTETEIAKKIGRTRQSIDNLLELAAAPEGVRVMVATGIVSATEAVKTIRRDGVNATKTLQAAEVRAKELGKTKVTARMIPAGKHGVRPLPPLEMPRILQSAKIPLSTAAEHVVAMAEGLDLPDGLRRAIAALADSLS